MYRLLIIDDEIEIIDVVTEYFRAEKFQIVGISNSERAVETVAEQNPAVILLDIMMPKIDGYEVARRLKADARTSHVPIIFLSGKDRQDDGLRFSKDHGELYIRKPISLPELKETVLCLIERSLEARR